METLSMETRRGPSRRMKSGLAQRHRSTTTPKQCYSPKQVLARRVARREKQIERRLGLFVPWRESQWWYPVGASGHRDDQRLAGVQVELK